MTNILFTIATLLATNVVETSNERGCTFYQGHTLGTFNAVYHPLHDGCGPHVPATAKTVVTTVERITNAVGGPYLLELGREKLSVRTEFYATETAWKKTSDEVYTNFLRPHVGLLTNSLTNGILIVPGQGLRFSRE